MLTARKKPAAALASASVDSQNGAALLAGDSSFKARLTGFCSSASLENASERAPSFPAEQAVAAVPML